MRRTTQLIAVRKTLTRGLLALVACLIGWTSTLGSAHSGTISQVPLFISLGGTEPNLMFMLDDSGSMMFEVMPDDYVYWGQQDANNNSIGSVVYVFPRADGVYGATDYDNNVATIADGVAYTALMRSPSFNKVYYNPAITYTPWKKYDDTSYPNASPSCALHNPERPGSGPDYCRDLTSNLQNASSGTTNWRECDASGCTATTTTLPKADFWTATYFHYDGPDNGEWSWSNYTRVEIKSTTADYSGHGREDRSDCSGGVCTYAQEIQNFANWYTYYRSRILAARAGIGKAFIELDDSTRVGFGAINATGTTVDGISSNAVMQGVRTFTPTARNTFYNSLYGHPIPAEGTPLRLALDAAGQYFSRADDVGPWADTPGSSSDLSSSCRQSYTVLMTDGYWSGGEDYDAETADARDDNDSTAAATITGPGGQSYTYSPVSPFSDSRANTLADVAMYYWNRDLIGSLANEVPPTPTDPAFWQHMVTYGVGLGVTGTIDPDDAYDAIDDTTVTITWPDPDTTEVNCTGTHCTARIDDLLHASLNSRGRFFSAQDPDQFAEDLAAILADIVDRTSSAAAAVATNSTKIGTDTLIYQAKFDSRDWSGKVLAYALESDGTIDDPDGDGDIEEHAVWDTSAPGKIPNHSSRNVFGRIGTESVELDWDSLTTAQQSLLTGEGIDEAILDWLRGDQSNETPSGSLRARLSILGDIVNSSPSYVDSLNFGYEYLPATVTEQATYFAYREATQTRTKMLYVGANDGMLHAFDAETGVEKFAFVPNAALANLASLSAPSYTHSYFVDGSPQAGDAYFGGSWKTVLVGTMGAGGRSVFALDITNPDAFDESDILWELTDADLGYPVNQLAQPVIGRMQNGDWAVVLSNGFESDNHRAMLYVIRLSDGSIIKKIDTGVGDAATPNGLAAPVLVADSSRTIKYAYAGDLLGNLWKFDLSDASASAWDIAFASSGAPMPLFRARSVSGGIETPQPITAAPEIGEHPQGGYMLFFGTGKFFEVGDDVDANVQSLYGIWDRNDGTTTGYVSATDRSTLQAQEILAEPNINGRYWRIISDNAVTWTGTGAQDGWFMDLISPVKDAEGERVVSVPLLRHGRAIFTTAIPATGVCESGGVSWILELDMTSGGRLEYSTLDVDGDGDFDLDDFATYAGNDVPVSGQRTTKDEGMTSTPAVVECDDAECKITSGSTGAVVRIREKGAGSSGRQSWRQCR
ncbi:pilus assembly protein [Thiorhodococcus minor]|uniref:Pilus assembly protein PilY n=1 Tax=Thiorhodococcus minor TaxID=57489 RepID=A0A6M0K5M0_9GAMM|nr:PilC/PilY family type IV pilus protein [Thiorhodococcus minor]NEV64729.1 pilus assembly protein PilY [Thiorhodococcus minor]